MMAIESNLTPSPSPHVERGARRVFKSLAIYGEGFRVRFFRKRHVAGVCSENNDLLKVTKTYGTAKF
jgi:hypothetical protein